MTRCLRRASTSTSTSTSGSISSALALVAVATVVACSDDATQLVVVVDSDLAVPSMLDHIQVVVEGPTATSVPIDVDLSRADAPMLPLTLGVSPAGNALGPVTVRAVGRDGDRVIVEARARTTLVRGESRVLWLFLGRSCVDESCGSSERTCRDGQCGSIDVPWSTLPRWTGRVPPRDGSIEPDAGRRDGSIDGAPPPIDGGDAAVERDLGPGFDAGPPDDMGIEPDAGPEEDTGPPPPPCPGGCDDGMSCSDDVCDETLGRCVFTAVDRDGDTHTDAVCGGDDCDDTNREVHPGATEACDGDDDDCDGADDDGCPCSPLGVSESCTTTCGSMGMRTCAASGWLDCVPPSEACNTVDDDCDGQIDEGHVYVATGERELTSDGDASRRPTIALGAASIVVAWQDNRAGVPLAAGASIEAMPLGRDGAPAGSASRLSGSTPAAWPSIAGAGDGFAVVWWELTGGTPGGLPDGVGSVALDAEGDPIAPPVRVETTGGSSPSPVIVSAGTELGVAYEDAALELERFDLVGGSLGGTQRVGPRVDSVQIAIAWTGVEYAIAWREASRVFLGQGVLEPFRRTTVSDSDAEEEALSLAATSRGFVLVTGAHDGQALVHVSTDGGAGFAAPVVLTSSYPFGTGCDEDEVLGVAAVPAGPDQVLVLFTQGSESAPRISLARFSSDGTMLQPPTDVATSGAIDVQPAAVWVDDHAVLVWSSSSGGGCNGREIRSASIGCP